MKLDFVKQTEDKLTSLPGTVTVVDAQDDTKIFTQSSLESYSTEAMIPNKNEDTPVNQGCGSQMSLIYRSLPFERLVIEEGDQSVVKWTFYLNSLNIGSAPLASAMMNEFVLLLDQVSSNDYLEIWAPSFIDEFFAVGMYNLLMEKLKDAELCKKTRIHSPYILNTGGALFLALPCKKTTSDHMYCRISPPSVFAAGAHLDGISGITQQVDLFKQIYIQLTSCGLLNKTDVERLIEDQRCVILCGRTLSELLAKQQ